jgi:hypothetical protein
MLAAVEPPRIENIESEAALLGAMLQSRAIIDPVIDRVSEEDFSEPAAWPDLRDHRQASQRR